MADDCFDLEAPNFRDFTALDEDDDVDSWFERKTAEELGSEEIDFDEEQSVGCPSPKKRQKTSHFQNSPQAELKPRRSPRLVSNPSANAHKVLKSSEELELETVAAMKKKLAASRKKHMETFKAALVGTGSAPLKSVQPLTLPEAFHFESDQRIRAPARRVPETKSKDFTSSLRDGSSKAGKGKTLGELTCPQPFKLSAAKSTSSLHATKKFQSVAEKVAEFHAKTPERFKTSKEDGKKPRSAHKPSQLTVAKTPTLTTRGRSRPMMAMSRQEQEDAEYNEHKNQQFKAHPVNHKILSVSNVGVHKVVPKAATVPQEFNLHHTSRPFSQSTEEEEDENSRLFRAKPFNSRILEGPTGVKPVESQPVTIPQSPAFALRSRVRMPAPEPPQPPPSQAHAPPHREGHNSVPFRPKLQHSHTVPSPFGVEERSKKMLQKKADKIMQVFEEEKKAREFHASLLPSDEPDSLPPKQLRPITAPEPFHLEVDSRGGRHKEALRLKIEEEAKQARAQAEFKARPNKIVFQEPFIPESSSRPLTKTDNLVLNTDVRASQREQYNQHLKAHEASVTALKRERDERREQEENQAVQKLRKEMVHKATNIKKYKSFSVSTCPKPLTEPQTPNLRTQRISRKRVMDQ